MQQSAPAVQLETRLIPLNALFLDEANARGSADADPALADADDQLAVSIHAQGLLENLVVTPRDDRFGVTGGGRRLRALQRLADDGTIPVDHPVPCTMVPNDRAGEASIAENEVRVAMHPADQVRAFARLSREGASADQIAARFGVGVRTVQKRLRLGGLPNEILASWRDGGIRPDCVEAFATTADTALQRRLFESFSKSGMLYAHNVRHALAERHTRSDSYLAKFVGVEDYVAAGGRTEDPLFVEDRDAGLVTFLDPDVLHAVAEKKLAAVVADYAAEWKWTRAVLVVPQDEMDRYRQISPYRAGKPTEEEETTLSEAYDAMQELDERIRWGNDDAETNAEARAQFDRLFAETNKLEREIGERSQYSKNARKHAGVLATLDEHTGALQIYHAMLRPEDAAAYETAVKSTPIPETEDGTAAPGSAAGSDAAPGAPKAPKYTDALRSDLRIMRTIAVRSALSRDPAAAADILAFTLLRKSARADAMGYDYTAMPLSITAQHQGVYVSDPMREHESMARLDTPFPVNADVSWLAEKDHAAAFRAFRRLPDAVRATFLAHAVARLTVHALGDDDGAPPAQEQLVRDLDVDFPAELRAAGFLPLDPDIVWNRMNKQLVLDAGRAAFGEEWAAEHGRAKKKDLVAAAARDFRPDSSRSAESDGGADWLPPGFAPAPGPRFSDPAGDAEAATQVDSGGTDAADGMDAGTSGTDAATADPAASGTDEPSAPVDPDTGLPAFLVGDGDA